MKKCILIILASFLVFQGAAPLKACNNSSFTLVSSVTTAGPTYTITTSLCIGYGRTGIVFGADGPTNGSFSIAVFGAACLAPPTASLTSFTATTVAGTATNPPAGPTNDFVTFSGIRAGTGFGIGEQDNIVYFDPLCFCLDYTCISSTAACGSVGSLCQTLVFVWSGAVCSRPDSIRAIGIEGLAPFGGCWPNADMMIPLVSLPVTWNNFNGVTVNGGVNLDWNTLEEHDSKEFIVSRSRGLSGDFTEIGKVNASGDASGEMLYSFFDANPAPGLNQYQITMVNLDGQTTQSSVLNVTYTAPGSLSLQSLFPNPANGMVTARVLSETESSAVFSVWTLNGQKLDETSTTLLVGVNERKIDVSKLAPGVYFLRMVCGQGTLEKKIVVQ